MADLLDSRIDAIAERSIPRVNATDPDSGRNSGEGFDHSDGRKGDDAADGEATSTHASPKVLKEIRDDVVLSKEARGYIMVSGDSEETDTPTDADDLSAGDDHGDDQEKACRIDLVA